MRKQEKSLVHFHFQNNNQYKKRKKILKNVGTDTAPPTTVEWQPADCRLRDSSSPSSWHYILLPTSSGRHHVNKCGNGHTIKCSFYYADINGKDPKKTWCSKSDEFRKNIVIFSIILLKNSKRLSVIFNFKIFSF